MRNAKILSALVLSFASAPLLAQNTGGSTAGIDLFQGPNFALALLAIAQIIAIVAAVGILRSLTSNSGYFAKLRKLANEQSVKAIPIIVVAGMASPLMAQSAEVPTYPEWLRDSNTVMLVALNALLLFAFIWVITVIRRTIAMLMPPIAQTALEAEVAEVKEESKIMAALTDAVPVEREHEIMMDHEYDGIRELDNNLPPWWVYMFYVTIIFAFVYMIWYHVLPYSQNQHERYIAELLEAEEEKALWVAKRGEMVDETNVQFLADAADLTTGRAIYMEHCQACHAADGGGGVGPNLTDEYWIHGGGIKEIFAVVKYGVPAKGMIAWQAQLRPKEMAQVASYIQTLEGTTPANPKDPQGEKWVAPAGDDEQPVNEEQGGEADDTQNAETSAATAIVQ